MFKLYFFFSIDYHIQCEDPEGLQDKLAEVLLEASRDNVILAGNGVLTL